MKIGIEKESLVFDQELKPVAFDAKNFSEGLELDFADHQIELVTMPYHDVESVYSELKRLVDDKIFENKYVWPLSIPKQKQENITIKGTRTEAERQYRKLLQERYGNEKMLMSGIHLNFSNCDVDCTGKPICCDDPEKYHFELFKKIYTYGPLLMQFTSFSPYLNQQKAGLEKIGKNYGQKNSISIRNSLNYGFSNEQHLNLNYDTYQEYYRSIEIEQSKGNLDSLKELYSKLRFKKSYIELRFVDLNPYSKQGIEQDVLYLITETMRYLAEKELIEFNNRENIVNFDKVAMNGLDKTQYLKIDGKELTLAEHTSKLINNILSENTLEPEARKQIEKLLYNYQNNKLPINQMINEYQEQNYNNEEFGLRHLKHDQEFSVLFPELKMELSTKILIEEAKKQNLEVKILDELNNFIEIKNQNKSELIVQATKTNYDNYANVLAMENKYITKIMLERQGLKVPQGHQITAANQVNYNWFEKQMVVKPLDTNFGNGITILEANPLQAEIDKAITLALSFSKVVIVEEYVTGTEYRFLVINGKTESIVNRTPASVQGDGIHTISELVAFKNSSSLRNKGYIMPLERISLGEFEQNFLRLQNLSIDDIPKQGEIIYLRKNSNVSTGGDSHERFEIIPDYFKVEAEKAAAALDVKICGVDMIINDLTKKEYSIIEANFNPAIQMHTYPYTGTGKNVAKAILAMMFD